jgi:hypothetical protein
MSHQRKWKLKDKEWDDSCLEQPCYPVSWEQKRLQIMIPYVFVTSLAKGNSLHPLQNIANHVYVIDGSMTRVTHLCQWVTEIYPRLYKFAMTSKKLFSFNNIVTSTMCSRYVVDWILRRRCCDALLNGRKRWTDDLCRGSRITGYDFGRSCVLNEMKEFKNNWSTGL